MLKPLKTKAQDDIERKIAERKAEKLEKFENQR